jgi:hypothetical protein
MEESYLMEEALLDKVGSPFKFVVEDKRT